MLRPAISISSLILLVVIVAVAVGLSLFSYQFFASTSNQILDVASQEIKSNARIEVHDLAQLVANRLQSINVLLQTLANSPDIQNNEFERSKSIMNYRQNSTDDLTDFYMWLDQTGKIVWISNMNATLYQKYKGFDLSYRPYFILPRTTQDVYYSSLIESNDKVPRLYISYPIIGNENPKLSINSMVSNNTNSNLFKGVVVAAVKGDTMGNLVEHQMLPQFEGNIVLLDKQGVVLYYNNKSLIGQSIFDVADKSGPNNIFPGLSNNSLNAFLKTSLQNNVRGVQDLNSGAITSTVVYEPVTLTSEHFMTLFIIAPHKLASNVAMLIDQQKSFNLFILIIIGAVALGAALLTLTWNKTLKDTVRMRTEQLTQSNLLLTKSNQDLANANDQLKNQDKIQKEFINVAAHELRTPIQPILSIADQLKYKVKDREESELVDILIRNVKRFQRLAQDILDVTIIESNAMKLNKKKFDLNDLIYKVTQDFDVPATGHKINHDVKLVLGSKVNGNSDGKEAITVEADSERVAQVIWNLLSNAMKFTERGAISICTQVKDREVIVSVIDTGVGIDPVIKPKLFSKFVTNSYQGTGLGLYISKSIVEAHGGKMWAENSMDGKGGAAFYFSLQIANAN